MSTFSILNASNMSQADSLEDSSNWTAVTQFTQPGWRIALWAITYSFIVITSIVGNITIIWIILAHRRMRTTTNYFIVNLALSDLLMSTFNTIFNFIYASHNVWYFGEEFCRFQNWFPITAMFVSIYSMTAVAAERYMAIIHPFKPRLSAGSTRVIIGIIWLVAFGLAFPQCFYAEIMMDNGTTKCIVVWPDDVGSKHQLAYHIAVIVLIYLLPLMVMFVAYSIIGITLWSSAVPGNHLNRARYEHQVNAKKKFVKTMVVVVIIFAVCWLPYHIYFILGSFKEDIYQQKYIQQVYLAVFLLAMSSTMYNPIIYCCLNQRTGCSRDAGAAGCRVWGAALAALRISCLTILLTDLSLICISLQPSFVRSERFRSGFKLAFRWCPCVKATEKDKLKLMSPLYQTTHRKSRTTSFDTESQLNEKEKTSFTPTQLTL